MIRCRYLLAEYDADSDLQINGTPALFFIGAILLSITLLLSLVFLCARLASRRRRRNSPPPSNSTTHEAAPKPTPGINSVAIDDLPVVVYGAAAGAGDECCICLGIFEDADEVKILPQCRHCFHSECLDGWLKNQSTCPLCRDTLVRLQ